MPTKRSERSKPAPPPKTPAEKNTAGPLTSKRSWLICKTHLYLAIESMLTVPIVIRMIEDYEEDKVCSMCISRAVYFLRESGEGGN